MAAEAREMNQSQAWKRETRRRATGTWTTSWAGACASAAIGRGGSEGGRWELCELRCVLLSRGEGGGWVLCDLRCTRLSRGTNYAWTDIRH